MIADVHTKPLPKDSFLKINHLLGFQIWFVPFKHVGVRRVVVYVVPPHFLSYDVGAIQTYVTKFSEEKFAIAVTSTTAFRLKNVRRVCLK